MNTRRDVNARRPRAVIERPSWIWGINAVSRRIEVRPRSVREVYVLRAESARRERLVAMARDAQVPVREVDAATLHRVTGSDQHQGAAAHVDAFQYAELDTVLAGSLGLLLLLDQLQDPHNLGALIRTAAGVGMTAVVIPRHGASRVTPAVEKVAAGAVHDVPICQVGNLHRCLIGLRARGYWSIALDPRAEQSLFALDLPALPALVLGGEGGLRELVQETCDFRVSLPVRPEVESLNASVAGAVAMYEVLRRRSAALTG